MNQASASYSAVSSVSRVIFDSPSRKELILRAAIFLPILILFYIQIQSVHQSSSRQVGLVHTAIEGEPLEILELRPDGPARKAGLQIGDIILQINDRPIQTGLDYTRIAASFNSDEVFDMLVQRGEARVIVTIRPGMEVDRLPLLLNGLLIFIYFVMGMSAIVRRPGFLPANLLYWVGVFLAAEIALPTLMVGQPAIEILYSVMFYALAGAQFSTELHLVSLLPERPKWLKRRPWIIPAYYAVGGTVAFVGIATYLVEFFRGYDLLPWSLIQVDSFLLGPALFVWATLLVLILLPQALRFPSARGRRQAGTILLGLLPWALYIYLSEILLRFGAGMPMWTSHLYTLVLLPFPIAIFSVLLIDSGVRSRVLNDLIGEVESADDLQQIGRLISKDLDLAFHTKRNCVFFRERSTSELTSVHSTGGDDGIERIPHDYEILKLADTHDPLIYSRSLADRLPQEERDWLDRLDAQLLVPLIGTDHSLMGLLILGRKASEEPYTVDDLALLRALARQITLAYENLHLHDKVREKERIEREMLERFAADEIIFVKDCPKCGRCFDSTQDACEDDGEALQLSLPVERYVAGRYRLDRVLGRGGVAVVYLCNDMHLDREVAVKVLARSVIDDGHALIRFKREAKVAARLVHPKIISTHDFGETQNGCAYIVMEYLKGRTLREVLRENGALTPEIAAGWFDQILDGLIEAHRLGVVHRDLKPDNVMVYGEGDAANLKLLDFGLAKMVESTHSEASLEITMPGTIMGTLAYMAPEQLAGYDVDARCDLYAIGVMAYEALIGKRPFEGRSASQFQTAIQRGKFVFPAVEPEHLALQMIFEKCFKSNPAARYGTAEHLRRVLVPALASSPTLPGSISPADSS